MEVIPVRPEFSPPLPSFHFFSPVTFSEGSFGTRSPGVFFLIFFPSARRSLRLCVPSFHPQSQFPCCDDGFSFPRFLDLAVSIFCIWTVVPPSVRPSSPAGTSPHLSPPIRNPVCCDLVSSLTLLATNQAGNRPRVRPHRQLSFPPKVKFSSPLDPCGNASPLLAVLPSPLPSPNNVLQFRRCSPLSPFSFFFVR